MEEIKKSEFHSKNLMESHTTQWPEEKKEAFLGKKASFLEKD